MSRPEARVIVLYEDKAHKSFQGSPDWKQLEKDLSAAAKRAVEAWPPEPGRVDPAAMVAAREELQRVQ